MFRFSGVPHVAISGANKVASTLGFAGLPFQIHAMLILTFLLSLGRNIAFPYIAIYMAAGSSAGGLQIDPSYIGLILMVGGLTSILTYLFSGTLCDRFGRRKMLIAYIFPTILLTLSLAYIRTAEEFLVVYALNGAVGAFYDPAYNTIIADIIPPKRREEIYGLSYMIGNVGALAGPLIGGIIIIVLPYSALFLFATLLVVMAAPIILFWIKETRPQECKSAVVNISGIYKDRSFLLFCILAAMTNIVYSQFYGLLSVYTQYAGLPAYDFGVLYSINGAMVVLFQIPIRKAAMRIGSTKAFIIAQTLYAAGFSYFFFSRNFFQFLVGNITLTLGEITFVPANYGFIANLASSDKRGRYMALASLFSGIGGSAGNLIGFRLYDTIGNKQYTWAILGSIGFLTLPGYIYLHKVFGRSRSVEYP
jgi:MFS family permease